MRGRLLASLVAMLLVGGAAATSAGAAWTGPVTISAPGQNAITPQVAVDAQGDAVFVWRRFDGASWRIQARARSAAGALGPIQNLSAAGQSASQPQVDVDSDGDAVFVWRRYDGPCCLILSRTRSAGGTLGPVQTLSAGGGRLATLPQLGVDNGGDAVFVWTRSDGTYWRVQIRARSATGTLGPIRTISPVGHGLTPQVAVDPAGRAVFTWQRGPFIEARARSAAGALSPVQTLSPPPGPNENYARSPQVGVDAQGNAVFAWNYHVVKPPNPRGATLVQARARSAAGALSPVQNIVFPPIGGGGCGCFPQVAVDPTGDAVFTWEYRHNYLEFPQVQVRARSDAGALSPRQDLTASAGDTEGSSAQVGMDGAGNAVITWDRPNAIGAQVRAAAGPLGPLQTFPPSGDFPQVAVNGAGDAVLTWQSSDGTHTVIQAAAGP
jgi:hypothetical protein